MRPTPPQDFRAQLRRVSMADSYAMSAETELNALWTLTVRRCSGLSER